VGEHRELLQPGRPLNEARQQVGITGRAEEEIRLSVPAQFPDAEVAERPEERRSQQREIEFIILWRAFRDGRPREDFEQVFVPLAPRVFIPAVYFEPAEETRQGGLCQPFHPSESRPADGGHVHPSPAILELQGLPIGIGARRLGVFDLSGVRTQIVAGGFPHTHPQLCVYLQVTGHEGRTSCRVVVLGADDVELFAAEEAEVELLGPLRFIHLRFWIVDGAFPEAGVYYVQVLFDGRLCGERALTLLATEGGRNGQPA
jgi:hypothetical protein